MSKRALLAAPLLLFLVSAALAGEAWLKPTRKAVSGKGIESYQGPPAYLVSGHLPEIKLHVQAPSEHPTLDEEWWLWYDPEGTWLGNAGYYGVGPALEFVNDAHPSVSVKAIRYNFYYPSDTMNYRPLLGHVWDDDGTGRPRWLDPGHFTSIKNFDLDYYPSCVDWRYDLEPPYPEFGLGEHFWVGWQMIAHLNYMGWGDSGVPPYHSWWWDTREWLMIFEEYGFAGDWTTEVLVEYEGTWRPEEQGRDLSTGQPVTLSIYDLSGRLVKILSDNGPVSSFHFPLSVSWDGKDSSGRAVPAGIYFCKLTCGEFSRTGKMVVLK